MVRKQEKPEPDPINKSAHPLKRRRPIRTFNTYDKKHKFVRKNDFRHIGGRVVQDREGYFWIHDSTVDDEITKDKIVAFLKKNKKETKVVKNGSVFEIFIMKEY